MRQGPNKKRKTEGAAAPLDVIIPPETLSTHVFPFLGLCELLRSECHLVSQWWLNLVKRDLRAVCGRVLVASSESGAFGSASWRGEQHGLTEVRRAFDLGLFQDALAVVWTHGPMVDPSMIVHGKVKALFLGSNQGSRGWSVCLSNGFRACLPSPHPLGLAVSPRHLSELRLLVIEPGVLGSLSSLRFEAGQFPKLEAIVIGEREQEASQGGPDEEESDGARADRRLEEQGRLAFGWPVAHPRLRFVFAGRGEWLPTRHGSVRAKIGARDGQVKFGVGSVIEFLLEGLPGIVDEELAEAVRCWWLTKTPAHGS